MKVFVTLAALLGACSAHEGLHAKWSSFKAQHGKSYHPSAEQVRLQIFAKNHALIEAHNAKFARGEVSYELGHNELSDMTPQEIRESKFGAVIDAGVRSSVNASEFVNSMPNAPASVDWRGRAVTGVRNQASCGSCYTFSATGAIESFFLMKHGQNLDLSEQHLVDCTKGALGSNFNFGCGGGDPAGTMQWAIRNGQHQEASYPYVSGNSKSHGACRAPGSKVMFQNFRLGRVSRMNENALADAVATYGPIAVTLNGENNEFYNYRGGIYNNPACSTQINHAVLLVGYGSQNGQNYWIIKNSWGPNWGEQGYMRMARGYNRCGIVSADSYYIF